MKRILLIFILLPVVTSGFAQKVPSNCTAHDSVIAKYKTDAQRIALSRVYRFSSSHKNNVNIPKQWTDSILRAIIAVYNAPLPKTDTVNGETINILDQHSRPYQAGDPYAFMLNSFGFYADTTEQWVKDLKQKKFPTADAQVNSFMLKYHISDTWFSNYANYGYLTSDSNYNIEVLAKAWKTMRGVYKTELSGAFDGSFLIVDSITKDYVRVIFSYGYNDCPAGCISRRNWLYKVYFNCDVEFVRTWEGALQMPPPPPAAIPPPTEMPEDVVCYPNPFTDKIWVDNIWRGATYSIVNINGVVLRHGEINDTQISNLGDVPKGIYTLILSSKYGSSKTKIVK